MGLGMILITAQQEAVFLFYESSLDFSKCFMELKSYQPFTPSSLKPSVQGSGTIMPCPCFGSDGAGDRSFVFQIFLKDLGWGLWTGPLQKSISLFWIAALSWTLKLGSAFWWKCHFWQFDISWQTPPQTVKHFVRKFMAKSTSNDHGKSYTLV